MAEMKSKINKLKKDKFTNLFLKIIVLMAFMLDSLLYAILLLMTVNYTIILSVSVLTIITSLILMIVYLRKIVKAGN